MTLTLAFSSPWGSSGGTVSPTPPHPWTLQGVPEALPSPPLQLLLHLPLVQGPFTQDGGRIELDRGVVVRLRERVGAGCDGVGGGLGAASAPLPLCPPHPPPALRSPRPKGPGCPQWDRPGGGRIGRSPRIPAHRVEGQFLGLEDTRREPEPRLLLGVLRESGPGICTNGCPQMHPGEAWPTPLCPARPVRGPWAGPCSCPGR